MDDNEYSNYRASGEKEKRPKNTKKKHENKMQKTHCEKEDVAIFFSMYKYFFHFSCCTFISIHNGMQANKVFVSNERKLLSFQFDFVVRMCCDFFRSIEVRSVGENCSENKAE